MRRCRRGQPPRSRWSTSSRSPGGGTRHILRTQFPVGGNQLFRFGARPGTVLVLAAASLSVATAQGTTETAPPDSVNVQETFEPNNDPATAPMIAPGAMYVSYLTTETDVDFFRANVPAAAGTRTTIRLSHLPEGLRPRRLRAPGHDATRPAEHRRAARDTGAG